MTDQSVHSPAMPSPEAIAQGYEPSEVKVGGMAGLLVGCAISGLVLFALVWWFMKVLLHHDSLIDTPHSAVVDRRLPRSPNLQPSVGHDTLPYQDVEAMRSREDAVFLKLGWDVDPKTHRLTIPDVIVKQVQAQEATRAAQAKILPTATPGSVNTILPGPPAAQNTHEGGASPQGPSANYPGNSSEQRNGGEKVDGKTRAPEGPKR